MAAVITLQPLTLPSECDMWIGSSWPPMPSVEGASMHGCGDDSAAWLQQLSIDDVVLHVVQSKSLQDLKTNVTCSALLSLL